MPGESQDIVPEEVAETRNTWEKIFERLKKQNSLLMGEVDGLSEELLFKNDNFVRDLLRTKKFVDIDIKRIFRIASG